MPLPQVQLGPFVFSSGYNPKEIKGPDRKAYAIEHQIPAREGGITEYVGSEQPKYQLRGFISPPDAGPFTGTAGAIVSGNGYIGLNADSSMSFLQGIRGSGPHLLRIESTGTLVSGYPILYENGFFYIDKETWGFEAGKTYPYYPYGIDLRGASTKTYGQSSGSTILAPTAYFSGYIMSWRQRSGLAQGEVVVGLGLYVRSVASGNAKVAVYGTGLALQAQSAGQAVHSGWNYFPLNPSFTTTSGITYELAFKGDATSSSGYVLSMLDTANTSGTFTLISGQPYANAFVDPESAGGLGLQFISGTQFNFVVVTT